MSCVAAEPTFRLLDALVGWDVASAEGLTRLNDEDGLTLELEVPARGLTADEVVRRFGSPRLARGCGPCEWYLVTPRPSRLLRRDRCATTFEPVWRPGCEPELLDAVAVAAFRHEFAVSDPGSGRVSVWSGGGRVPSARIPADHPGPLAFTDSGQLVVAIAGTTTVRRFSPSGDDLSAKTIPMRGEVTHLATAPDCALWAVVRRLDGTAVPFRAPRAGEEFVRASGAELAAALPELPIAALSDAGFCLREAGASGTFTTRCYSWYGRPLDDLAVPLAPNRVPRGQLLTTAIDSGIPRCRWHRVRVDADMPAGTGLSVAVATSDVPDDAAQGNPLLDPAWSAFDAGIPHPHDWSEAPAGALDFLVDQPPGRYLRLRLRLTGQGARSPVVRRVRLDFPRATSFDLLPGIYRQAPEAEDFGERFVSLFDASIDELDHAIERHPALLDVEGVPAAVLPWLGTFLDLAAEPWWGHDRYRRVLQAAPELYRRRGTPGGLADAIELVFGVRPALDDGAAARRAWGALGRTARLRAVRLFGRSRSRMFLGASRLGVAPVRGYGDPDLDPLTAGAYRLTVLMPAGAVAGRGARDALERLVAAQAPAHVVPSVRVGGSGFVLGTWSAVGIDTVLGPLPAPVLGGDSGTEGARLSRASVLWTGRGRGRGFQLGRTSAVGIHTVAR